MTFASLDFETVNYSRVSICAAGVSVFEDALPSWGAVSWVLAGRCRSTQTFGIRRVAC